MDQTPPVTPSSTASGQPSGPSQGSSKPSGSTPARAGTPVRVAAVILAFILAFVAAAAVVTMLEVAELTPCEDVTSVAQLVDGECFDGSASAQSRTQIFGWIGAGLALISIVAALNLGMTGRGRRSFALLVAATVVMFLLSLIL